eukprot:gb/GFBE01041831.1/.p1 GENE.gb/GFBE01041831.1/~~gb/GFBE01041831.1/.p1  ORF type:complete len:268 (+),score=38.65 gb/GFBE01041831.1/:1-804(+)
MLSAAASSSMLRRARQEKQRQRDMNIEIPKSSQPLQLPVLLCKGASAKKDRATMAESTSRPNWCDRSPHPRAWRTAPVQDSSRARHRQAIRVMASLQTAACEIQRCWRAPQGRIAFLRLVYSEARRLHQQRSSFKRRAHLTKQIYATEGEMSSTPTLWQLSQCPAILREVLQDIRAAVRMARIACSSMGEGLQAAVAPKRVGCKAWELLKSHWSEIRCMAIMRKRLSLNLGNEARWKTIWRSVLTPGRERQHLYALPAEEGEEEGGR